MGNILWSAAYTYILIKRNKKGEKMGKRIFYFLLTNVLVLVTISIILSLTGGWNYIGQNGIDYGALLIFRAVIGFIGAFISVALSSGTCKRCMSLFFWLYLAGWRRG